MSGDDFYSLFIVRQTPPLTGLSGQEICKWSSKVVPTPELLLMGLSLGLDDPDQHE